MKQFGISLLVGIITLPVSFWAIRVIYGLAAAVDLVPRSSGFMSTDFVFAVLGSPICAIASFTAVFFLIGRAQGDFDD
jgi:hypothetical protein